MALTTVVKTTADGSVSLTDGTPTTPLTLGVRFSNGDINIGGLTNSLRDVTTIVARQKTIGLRKGAPVYPTIAFSLYLTDLGEATSGTVMNWEGKTAPKPPQKPINDSFKQTPEQAAQPELPKYEKTKGKPEDNWVWTPQWQIDMHDPRWWGRVKFVK